MKILFSGKSIQDRGTLCQLKNAFNRNSVTPSDVMNNFNQCEDFLRLVTEQYVCILAMKQCGMADIKSSPARSDPGSSTHDSKEDRRQFLKTVSKEIVDKIWLMPSRDTINSIKEADLKEIKAEWCLCGEGNDSTSCFLLYCEGLRGSGFFFFLFLVKVGIQAKIT